jgi:DNA-binding IscR family transcriptional regulator
MHPIWEDAQEKMVNVLARSNFADLVKAERQAETAAS